MKKILLVLVVAVLFVGCDSTGERCMVREIPYSKQADATQYIEKLMQSIQVQTRNDDEDWDDFIAAAHESALMIYGENINGTWVDMGGGNRRCDCNEERAKQQHLTNGKVVTLVSPASPKLPE